jgi:hypothetical protein
MDMAIERLMKRMEIDEEAAETNLLNLLRCMFMTSPYMRYLLSE